MEKLKNTKILGWVGLGLIFIGTFLPYMVASAFGFSTSVSLFGYWEGKVMFLVTFVNALFIFKELVKKYVPSLFNSEIGKKVETAKPIFSLIPTGVAVLLNIYLMAQVSGSGYSYIGVHFGIGFYVIWLGIASLVAYAILYKEPANAEETAAPAAAPKEEPKAEEPTDETNK